MYLYVALVELVIELAASGQMFLDRVYPDVLSSREAKQALLNQEDISLLRSYFP
jgi:hypothetical protein